MSREETKKGENKHDSPVITTLSTHENINKSE
jgi:hypothetical protein